MKSDIVGDLRQFCTDWDGSKIQRNAEPIDGIHCGLLIDAADEIERLRKELDTALNDRAGAIGAIADIRMKTGVGVKPMLDELADAIVDKIDEARGAKSTIETMSADAIHAIRKMLDELGVPKASFIDDHVMNGLVWARKQGLEEAAKVAEEDDHGYIGGGRGYGIAADIRKLMEPRADD